MNEKNLREHVGHELNRWGLGNDDESNKFEVKLMNAIIEKSKRKEEHCTDFDSLKRNIFPKTLAAAYEFFLLHETIPPPFYECEDKLNVDAFWPPYYKKNNRYLKDAAFQRFTSSQLDPLKRFRFRQKKAEEEFFDRWFVDDNEDPALLGTFFEAALTCHALQNEACFHCKFRHCLRWNAAEPWQDLVCINCQSIFEVKTKHDMEKVEKCFKQNTFPTGSFGDYCNINNSKLPQQKIFLVILPRTSTVNRKRQLVHPVSIAEVDSVVPTIVNETFNTNRSTFRVKSTTAVKLNTRCHWFNLPDIERIPRSHIVKQVYIERFSLGRYESYRSLKEERAEKGKVTNLEATTRSDKNNKEVKKSGIKGNAEFSVKELVKQFDQMKVPDNWEDEYSE